MIQIEDIKRLSVKPGDTLVVTLPGHVTAEVAKDFRERLPEHLPEGVAVLVVNDQVKLSVVPKPRSLCRLDALADEQRKEITEWLRVLGYEINQVVGVTVVDDQVTVEAHKFNSEGKRYPADREHIAAEYVTVPLRLAPSWLADVAA